MGSFRKKVMSDTVTTIKAREVLGDSAKNMTDVQIRNLVVKFQFLAESWLDLAEREILKGKTVQELLELSR